MVMFAAKRTRVKLFTTVTSGGYTVHVDAQINEWLAGQPPGVMLLDVQHSNTCDDHKTVDRALVTYLLPLE